MGKAVFFVLLAIVGYKVYTDYYPAFMLDRNMKEATKAASAQLPKIYGNAIRVESIRYDKRVLYSTSTILDSVPVTDNDKPVIEAAFREMYCKGMWKDFSAHMITIENTIGFEAVHYRGVTWVFKESPELCV